MKPTLPALLAALALVATPAVAAPTSRPDSADPRIKVLEYDPWQVYRVVGAFRTATQILFDDDEEILHVALGDTVAWEVAPEANILFVKPREKHGATNLIVTTRRGLETRNYNFELRTRDGPITAKTPDTYFQIRFRYPEDEAARAGGAAAQLQAMQAAAIGMALDRGVIAGPRNLKYTVQGSSALQPSEVSDNGRFTVLRFPGARDLPAFFTVNPDGKEAVVPFDVRGEFVVLHTVGSAFRLRRGDEVLCIYNEAVKPYGVDYGTGTGSPVVERTIRPEATR